ncbi:MAG: hypothetical protein EAZ15_09110 [Sphingobacteriales bacterium]|nr:MAG: hypothetical protein EAZ15_09110 [Sphingobacteriales bacterium]
METRVINIPPQKIQLVTQLLKELGVVIEPNTVKTPNALTAKTIKNAHKGKGLAEPIKNIKSFIQFL